METLVCWFIANSYLVTDMNTSLLKAFFGIDATILSTFIFHNGLEMSYIFKLIYQQLMDSVGVGFRCPSGLTRTDPINGRNKGEGAVSRSFKTTHKLSLVKKN